MVAAILAWRAQGDSQARLFQVARHSMAIAAWAAPLLAFDVSGLGESLQGLLYPPCVVVCDPRVE